MNCPVWALLHLHQSDVVHSNWQSSGWSSRLPAPTSDACAANSLWSGAPEGCSQRGRYYLDSEMETELLSGRKREEISLNPTLLLVKIQGILFTSALQILFFRGLHLTGYLVSSQVGARRAGSGPGVMILGWNCHSPRGAQLTAATSAALGPGFSHQGPFFLRHLETSLLRREADKIHEKGPSVPNGPPLRTSCGPFSCPQVKS